MLTIGAILLVLIVLGWFIFGVFEGEKPRIVLQPFPEYLSIGSRYETEWMKTPEIEEMGRRWKAASNDGGKHVVS